jgi:enolase
MSNKITDIIAEQIYDSRNSPTLKVTVYANDYEGTFLVPSGKSTGKFEACELRDEANSKGSVHIAIEKIENIIKPKLLGLDPKEQSKIDQILIELDGTDLKSNLGGNSIIGVSIACAKLSANILNIPLHQYLSTLNVIGHQNKLPFMYFNLINGGGHAKTKLAFQEYHIVPQVNDISESVAICKNIQEKLDKHVIDEYGHIEERGDEGGVVLPEMSNVVRPLEMLMDVVKELDYQDKVKFALDVAASSFYDHQNNVYKFMDRNWTRYEMINLYKEIDNKFPMISIEDPLDEEDFEGFAILQKELPNIKIIGDDLTVTNVKRLSIAIKFNAIQGLIIKPNQIGTLSETIQTIKIAHENNLVCIVSHRSGETMDDFIADLAFAFGCFGLKSGAWGPKERNVKYEKLIKITSDN